MTDDELAAIEARANAATPGPWTYQGWLLPARTPGYTIGCDVSVPVEKRRNVAEAQTADNAAFIAAARTDVPALVAEVRRFKRLAEDTRKASSGEIVSAANALSAALREQVSIEEACRRVIAAWADGDWEPTMRPEG